MGNVLRYIDNGLLYFKCPGCNGYHTVYVEGIYRPATLDEKYPKWTWNNSLDKPTFQPSLLIRSVNNPNVADYICHSYITDGKIQFLSDCTHASAGQTLDMIDIEGCLVL